MKIGLIAQELYRSSYPGIAKKDRMQSDFLAKEAEKEFLAGGMSREEFLELMVLRAECNSLIRESLINWYTRLIIVLITIGGTLISVWYGLKS